MRRHWQKGPLLIRAAMGDALAGFDPRQLFALAARDDVESRLVVRSGERNTEPISVFVSKKTGRLYIRQAWMPIHEAPVTFKEPELPLGTHVYVAMEKSEDGKTAGGALERFEMTPETKALISDKLWAGASLIVSDQGLSHEMGKYTDFIVLTR